MRNNEFFEALYYQLIERYWSLFSVNRLNGISIKELFIVDSTTVRLFSDSMKGIGRNQARNGCKKGGLKVDMLIDAISSMERRRTVFVRRYGIP